MNPDDTIGRDLLIGFISSVMGGFVVYLLIKGKF